MCMLRQTTKQSLHDNAAGTTAFVGFNGSGWCGLGLGSVGGNGEEGSEEIH